MSHYFEINPTSKSNKKNIECFIKEKKFSFFTDNDVFSKKGLDFGTRTLLESLNLEKKEASILDFGCGYGPIGIFLASNGYKVDMIDINLRALKLALENAEKNHVEVNAFQSDMYEKVDKKYDYIISNPPIRIGKEKLFEILFGASKYLNSSGHLIFVIHKDQGAKSLLKKLEEKYIVKVVDKNKGFFVIDCQNH